MRLQVRIFMLLSSITLAVCGPYTIIWYATERCTGRHLTCSRLDAFECCDQPPSPSSLPYARAYSGGDAGLLVFTEVTADGGCGNCESGGSLNTCYLNVPFNTALVAPFTQCKTSRVRRGADDMSAKVPFTTRHAECKRSAPIDMAYVDGVDYDLTGSDRLEIMDDVMTTNITDEDFGVKWAHLERRELPSSDAPTSTIALS